MNKIKLSVAVPHVLAVVVFLVVTILFFGPIFFENKIISQYDIQQFVGSSKILREYREATGQEGLWAGNMFCGMPAYLVNLEWDDGIVVGMKKVISLFLPHPVCNFFLAFISYYILLLSFRIRPYLAIAGALAFGLSSFMIIGLGAGHNSRIGAIAFMPMVMAGIHLAFSGKRVLGFGLTTLALALQLRENHLQMTYYLIIIVMAYGLVMLVRAFREKQIKEFLKTLGLLVPAALIAAGSFFGPFWAINEYSHFSIRGPSELTGAADQSDARGLSKSYAFEYSNGILEPMTLLIPNFYGGPSFSYLVQDQNSQTYNALVNSGSQEQANQLARFTSAYWGPQSNTAPYYAGAIIIMLFVIGLLFAGKQFIWWLAPLSAFSIMMSWGDSFPGFNYFLFDYLPAYNKFRSVTFALIIIIFAMPLLGLMGLERMLKDGWNKQTRKKILWATLSVPAICFLLALTGGFLGFLRPEEMQLPSWFRSALYKDRLDLFRGDAWRSFWFTIIFAGVLLAVMQKWIKETYAVLGLVLLTLIDLSMADRRYFNKDNFQRKRENRFDVAANGADMEIQKDKGYYRVYNMEGGMNEAQTSYFHYSIGGYHGAKLRRYLDLYDAGVTPETKRMIDGMKKTDSQAELDFSNAGVINMLNVKYLIYGNRQGFMTNAKSNGPAWFVQEVTSVKSPDEELTYTTQVDTKHAAVVDGSKFKVSGSTFQTDSVANIKLVELKPPYIKYESESSVNGFAVFSEIYYPKGWHAKIDGVEVPILRANYILRALEIPAGKHTIEFTFEPKPYFIGNKITMASSWLLLVIVAGSLGWGWGIERIKETE